MCVGTVIEEATVTYLYTIFFSYCCDDILDVIHSGCRVIPRG